jgi:hypothetical protein
MTREPLEGHISVLICRQPRDFDFFLDIPIQWLEDEAARLLEGGKAEAKQVYTPGNGTPVHLPDGLQLQVRYESTAWEGAEKARRDSVRTWQDLLEYNKAFLRGELQGTYYHGGPLLEDQIPLELLAVHEHGAFTIDGQGSLSPSVGDIEEFPPTVSLHVQQQDCQRGVEVTRHGTFGGGAFATFQRAYLLAMVPRRLVERIIAGLRDEADEVSGALCDMKTGEEVFSSEGMPKVGCVTVERCAPTPGELDLTVPTWQTQGFTCTGSDTAKFEAVGHPGEMRRSLAPGVADAIIAEEELCMMILEEKAYCADYPRSLPARLLLWITAP